MREVDGRDIQLSLYKAGFLVHHLVLNKILNKILKIKKIIPPLRNRPLSPPSNKPYNHLCVSNQQEGKKPEVASMKKL